jgi:hypothetical protein
VYVAPVCVGRKGPTTLGIMNATFLQEVVFGT